MLRNYFAQARERSWKIYSRYYGHDCYRHHEARYLEEVTKHLTADSILLDAGAGMDMVFTRQIASKVKLAVGTDIGELRNVTAGSSYGVRADLCRLPFKDGIFDIVTSMSVIEHLQNPAAAFKEFARVLKTDAIAVLQTPNKYDYVSCVARFTPLWFHRRILSCLLERKEEDTFPTFFYGNSKKCLASLLNSSSLTPLKIVLFNQYPAYLMFSPLVFRLGILYERITSRLDICAQLRAWILVVAKKSINA